MTIEEQTQIEEDGGYREYAIEEYKPSRRAVLPPDRRRGRDVHGRLRASASRCCSRARPAAARPASSSTWRGASAARSRSSRAARTAAQTARATQALPLVTVACHEDLTASDLVGRYLLEGETTRWIDGPLTRAVKAGAICYLDEVVEARKDTTVLIHPLTDHRRLLPIEKRGQVSRRARASCSSSRTTPATRARSRTSSTARASASSRIEFDVPAARAGGGDHRARERRQRRAATTWRSWARRCATCASTA